jgi:hypothetical protein
MSRTIRRKNSKPHKFLTHTWERAEDTWVWYYVEREDAERRLAQYYSDQGSHWHWFSRHKANPGVWAKRFWQKVYRQDSRNQLRKFSLDEEFEVQIRNKPRYPWYD